MKILLQVILTAIPVAATSSWLTTELAQEPAKQEPAKPIHEMSEAEMMQLMMELGTPGEPHKELAKSAGKWDVKMSMKMDPAGPWEVSEGSSNIKMIMGGRYMAEQTTFEMMGMESKGMLLQGYDNLTKTYQTVWIDTWGTRMTMAEGRKISDSVIEYHGTMKDFASPEGRPYMFRVTTKSDDETLFEMYDTIPETPEAPMPKKPNVMVMKMEYTRAAE
jgi:hypothetical protein